jgi:ribosome-interacting GTPase 1
MSTVRVEVQLSSEQLFKAVEQLNQPELEEFVSKLVILYTHKKASTLLKEETELFLRMHQGITIDSNTTCEKFIDLKKIASLSQEEYKALLYLSEKIDRMQAERIEYMAELAKLRGISLTKLMEDIGLQ